MPRLSATALAAFACAYACEAADKVSALKLASDTESDLGVKKATAEAKAVCCDVFEHHHDVHVDLLCAEPREHKHGEEQA